MAQAQPDMGQVAPAQPQAAAVGAPPAPLVVGCALLPKKVQRYLTPRMLAAAAQHGLQLRPIDSSQPLEQQGPFHVIVHKLRPNAGWEQELRAYVAAHPSVVVVDRLDKIQQLHNRATMLRPLQGAGITLTQPPLQDLQQPSQQPPQQVVRVQAPLQVEIGEGMSEADAQAALAAAGLAPPLLCKPLWTDGREGSHRLAVLHDLEALGRLLRCGGGGGRHGTGCSGDAFGEFGPPLVVQQFVEHGGVLFKVYVLGAQTYVTARPSLGETVLEPDSAVQQLPRISCVSVFSKQQQQAAQRPAAAAGAGGHDARPCGQQQPPCEPQQQQQQQQQQEQRGVASPSPAAAALAAASVWTPPPGIVAPPAWLTSALAGRLRQELGMQLFNFDLIVPQQQQQQGKEQQEGGGGGVAPPLCMVVDINFFPGVDKIPNFEACFVEFLLAAAAGGGGGGAGDAAPDAPAAATAAAATAAPAATPAAAAAGAGAGGASRSARRSSDGACAGSGSSPPPVPLRSPCCERPRLISGGGGGGGSGRRCSGSGGAAGAGSPHGLSSRHGSGGLDATGPAAAAAAAAVAAAGGQWGDGGGSLLGSSPPLQVAGCS